MRSPSKALALVVFAIASACSGGEKRDNQVAQGTAPPTELRVLSWVGYDEPEVVRPFEAETGIHLRFETFTGADLMFQKLSANPEGYDVVVIDPEYIQKLHAANLISPLDSASFDFSHYIPAMRHFPLCWIDGKLLTVLIRYGVNGLVYNTEHITAEEASSYAILWSPKTRHRVGIWDWYLPSMGVISLSAGFHPPYSSSKARLEVLQQKLTSLLPQVSAVFPGFQEINAAFARGDIWVAPALGEHTAAVLAAEGQPISWSVPREGAVMWIETLGIPPRARNRSGAIEYIKYMQRPSTQALMAWRRAYRSNIPNADAIALLTSDQRRILKVGDAQEAERLVNSLNVRMLPTDSNQVSQEREWQTLWSSFKNALGKRR